MHPAVALAIGAITDQPRLRSDVPDFAKLVTYVTSLQGGALRSALAALGELAYFVANELALPDVAKHLLDVLRPSLARLRHVDRAEPREASLASWKSFSGSSRRVARSST